uniref:Virion structural protein n=1 Tax=Nitrosopumivirus cobalaminus TaxID=3158414 RepID=A0AAU7N463_9VIRU
MVYTNDIDDIIDPATDIVVKLGRDYRAVNGIPIDFYERDDGTFIIGPSTAALVAASGKKSQTLFDVKPFNYINAKPIIDTSLYIGVGQKLSFNLYTGGGVLADRSSRGYTNTQLMLSSTHNDMQFGYALFNDNWLPADRYTDTGTDILGNKIPLRDALDRPIITNRLDIIESAYSATFGADSNINPNVDERFQATASPRFYGVDWYVRATPTTFNRLFTGIDQTTGVGTGATLNTSNVNNFEIGDDSYVEFYRSTLNIFTPINQTNTLTNYPSHFKIRSDKCILDTVTFNAEGSSATSLVLQKIPSRYINANGTERKAGQEFAFTSPTSSFVFVQSGANAFGQYGTTSTAGIQELGVTEDVKNITFDISWTTAIGFLSRNIDVILLDADDNQLAVKNIDTGSQGNSVTFNLPADLDTGVTSQAVRKLRVNVTTNNGLFSGTVGRALSITGTLAPVVIDINTFNIAQRFWTVPDYHKSDSIPHVSILGTVLPLVADADGKRTAKIKEIDARNFGLEGPIPAVSTTINPSTAAFIYTAFSGSDFGSYNDNVILEMDNILPATSVTFSASWTQAIASLTGRITTVQLLDLNNIVVSTITLTSSSTSLGTAVFTGGNVSRATKIRIIGAGGSGPFSGTVGRTVTFTVVEEKAAITEGFGSDDYMQILDSQNNPVKATTKTDGNLVALRTVKSNFKASDTQLPVALNYKLTRTDTSKAADGADDVTGFNNSILNESLRQYTIPHGTLVSDNTATKATYTLAAGVYGYQIHSHSFTVDSTTGGLNGMDLGAEEIEYDFRVFDRNAGNLTNRISFDNSGSVPKFTRDRNQGAPTLEQFSDFVVSEELKLLGDTALTSRNNSFFTYNSSTRHFFFDNIDLDLGTFWPDLNPNITPPTEDSPLNHIVETTGEITSFDVGNLLFLTRDKNNTSFYLRAIPLATRVTYRYTDPVSGNPVQGGGVPIGNELVYGAWYRIPKDVDITFEFNFIGRENVLLNVSKEAIDLSTIVLTDLSDPEDIGDTDYAPFVDPAYTAKEIDFTNDVITVRGDMTRIEFIILMKKELQLTATPATKENNGLFILDGSRLQLLFNIVQHSSGGSVAGMTNVQLLNSTVTRQDITNARGIFGDAVVESADLNVVTITGFPTTGVSLLRIEGITTPVTVTDQISDYTIVIDKSETPLYYFKHELRQPVFGALPKSGSLALVLPERFVNIGTYTAGSNTIASVTINSKTAFTPDARVYSSTEVLQYLNDLQGNVSLCVITT